MRRKKRKPRKKSSGHYSGSWALVLIDGDPIRRRALRDYHATEKNVLRMRGEIEGFETRDLPGYHRWEAVVFGPLLSEIREIESALADKQHLLDEVEEEAYWSRCSMREAYRIVMARRANPGEPDEEWGDDDEPFGGEEPGDEGSGDEKMFGDSDLPPGFDFQEYDRLSAAEKRKFRTSYEQMAALYGVMTGQPVPDLDEVLDRERPGGASSKPPPRRPHPNGPPQPRPEEERFKSLYRQLARQLHPDANPNQGWRERELWHEVQSAYQSRDLDRLEAVAGRVEMGLHGNSSSLPVHLLHRMTRDLRSALQALKKQMRQARSHGAWNFSARSEDRPRLEKQRREGLEAGKNRAGAELARLSAILDAMASKVDRPKRARRARSVSGDDPRQMEFF